MIMISLQVKKKQQDPNTRMKAHNLSNNSQNDFLEKCGEMVRNHIRNEINNAGYFSIMVDATPDSAHIEQQTFIIRYLAVVDELYTVKETFLEFVDCCEKTGLDIANLILARLEHHGQFIHCLTLVKSFPYACSVKFPFRLIEMMT
jgi:hypothetical protein